MRIILAVTIASLCVAGVARAGELFPADRSKPLFRVFAPAPIDPSSGAQPERLTFDDKHPLLVVRSLSALRLARDNKGALITLTPADADKFASITRRYNDALLLLEADGQMLEAMHITAPIVDGVIGFKYPEHGTAAEYFRRRFHLAEFK